jgi:hypothetical protein
MTTIISPSGQKNNEFATWDLTKKYRAGDLVIYSGTIYEANDLVPANTPFVIDTTGATWAIAVSTVPVVGQFELARGGIITETDIPTTHTGNTIAIIPSSGDYLDQQLLIYPTAGSANNHLHLTSGNLYNTELFFGNDSFYVKLANTGNVEINTDDSVGNTSRWAFDATGNLTLPGNTFAVNYANGTPVQLGGDTGSSNIWVETFAFTNPAESIVQIATSVEYDAGGNIFALFSHSVTGGTDTFSSVAKLSPTGAVVWQVRFSANLNTDGWGLTYDGTDFVYIAGSTDGTPLTYKFATLTKIAAIDGTIVWNKTYDFGAASQSAVVDVDSDSNPIMVGFASNGTDNMIITTKVDRADGTVIWSKTLDGQGSDEAYGMAVGPTGEVVTIGYIDTIDVQDAAATLYADPVSNANWTINQTGVMAGSLGFDVSFVAGVPTFANISDTSGGRTVGDTVATILGSILGGADGVDDMVVKVETLAANAIVQRMVVVKYAANGTIDWQKATQFDPGYDCSGADADIDSNGNIYVCGQYNTPIGTAMSLVKFDNMGTKQWSRRVEGGCLDASASVVVGPDNNLYLSGVTADNNAQTFHWVVAKYSITGSVIWQRLIKNTASWTFAGGLFFGLGGGSTIDVGPDYVALAGGFGDFSEQPTATVVQIDTNGTPFSIGNWTLTAASFTGSLNDTASDIVVTDAGKTPGSATPTVADFVVVEDSSNFLVGTLYNPPSGPTTGIITGTGAQDYQVGTFNPTTRSDGTTALSEGDLWYDTSSADLKIWNADGGDWVLAILSVPPSIINGMSSVQAHPTNILFVVGGSTTMAMTSNGLELKGFTETVTTPAFNATFAPDVSLSTIVKFTATSNFTFNGFTSPVPGQSATIIITQDATGSRLMTSTMKFNGGVKTLSTAAGAIDIISVFYDGAAYYASLTIGYV